jgi:hypothetical protein
MITATLRVSRKAYKCGAGARHINPSARHARVAITNEFTFCARRIANELSEATTITLCDFVSHRMAGAFDRTQPRRACCPSIHIHRFDILDAFALSKSKLASSHPMSNRSARDVTDPGQHQHLHPNLHQRLHRLRPHPLRRRNQRSTSGPAASR